eukprot:833437-Lingulodinium_polyedra.AAC.1
MGSIRAAGATGGALASTLLWVSGRLLGLHPAAQLVAPPLAECLCEAHEQLCSRWEAFAAEPQWL